MQCLRRFAVIAFAAASLGACAPAAEQAALNMPERAKAQLIVENNNWLDVAVYLVRGSMRMRIGTVSSMSKGQFVIPDAYIVGVSDINVQASPIGSNATYNSGPIQVFPGARVSVQVQNQLRLSNYSVFGTQ